MCEPEKSISDMSLAELFAAQKDPERVADAPLAEPDESLGGDEASTEGPQSDPN